MVLTEPGGPPVAGQMGEDVRGWMGERLLGLARSEAGAGGDAG